MKTKKLPSWLLDLLQHYYDVPTARARKWMTKQSPLAPHLTDDWGTYGEWFVFVPQPHNISPGVRRAVSMFCNRLGLDYSVPGNQQYVLAPRNGVPLHAAVRAAFAKPHASAP